MRAIAALFFLLSISALAEGINERTHPDPGAQAKINRVIAQAWATRQPPVDHVSILKGAAPNALQNQGGGVNLGLAVGTVSPSRNGQMPRENNVVTRDNIVICLHCNGR